MSAALFDSITRIARHEACARAIAAVGQVVDIFPADAAQPDHAVTVQLRDSGLLLPRVPVAVGVLGFAAIPAAGDLVMVVFLDGDPNAPVVAGLLYHPDCNPPRHAGGEIVLGLPAGAGEPDLKLVVAPEPSIRLELPGEVLVELVEEQVTIQVGKMRISVSGAGGGRAEVAAGGSSITLKNDGDITVSSKGKLTLEGREVEISGSAKVKVSGAQVEVN